MASTKNLQLVDLGLDRRIEITTADDKRDPYARFTEKDLEGLRKSVQDPSSARLQDQNHEHLNAWSNFHQKVELEEGVFSDEPQLMNGQSHRAHLHFDMRHKEGLVAKPGGHSRHVPVSRHVPATRTHHLDPALDPTKFTTGKSKQAGPPPSFSRPLVGRSKRLKVQRRPIPAPRSPQNYEVKLADPGLWLNSVKNNTGQSNTLALLPTSQIETTSEPTENPKPTAAPKPTETLKPTAAPKPIENPKPTRTPKPVPKLENPFVGSNLPQPQINSSTPRAQPRASKDADLLLNFDSPTKKEEPEPDMMELADDGDKTDSDTAAASLLERKLYWLRELGVINDILADFSISDSKQVRQLEERQKKVQGMIHAASKKVSKAPISGGLQASRWADTDMDMATPREMPPRTFESKKPTNASDENRDYWQKALPKLPPLPANFMRTFKSPAPPSKTPQKPTKSIYESRYAC